jgi:hypothetical protein
MAFGFQTSSQERRHLSVILDYQNLHSDDSSPLVLKDARRRNRATLVRLLGRSDLVGRLRINRTSNIRSGLVA